MSQDFAGLQRGAMRDDLKQQITQLGIDYRLMTPFTSFVAVEDKVITEGGAPRCRPAKSWDMRSSTRRRAQRVASCAFSGCDAGRLTRISRVKSRPAILPRRRMTPAPGEV